MSHLAMRVNSHRNGIVEHCRSSICTPIDRIDAHHIGSTDYGLYVFDIRNGIVTNGDSCVNRVCCRFDPRCFLHISRSNLVSQHVCGNHPLTFLFRQVLHQFHNRLSTLTESCQNKWTTLVIIYEEMVKSSFYIFEDTSIYLRAMVSSLSVAHESRVICL